MAADRLADLAAAGWLHPLGQPGLHGRGGAFEAVVTGLGSLVAEAAADTSPEVRRFPPVVPSAVVERAGYLSSFPDLVGAVRAFRGDGAAHAAMVADARAGLDWGAALEATGTALCSAACHPLYATLEGQAVPPGGRTFDVAGWVFRHEPSADPARMQAFRQHELVHVGTAETAAAHRDLWRGRGAELLAGLGLEVVVEVAHDPFFGRPGRLLAASQIDAAVKHEIIAATGPDAPRTAVASTNCHGDHFGAAFGIAGPDGAAAHTACVGFGLERITLALVWAHGLDPAAWPAGVRRRLAL